MTTLGKFSKNRKLNDGSAVPATDTEPVSTVFVGVLTVSDRCSRGENTDLSGPNLQKIIQDYAGFRSVIKIYKILPDEADEIVENLIHWSDNLGVELIVTTGGTGLSSRDVTPEATSAVIERETPGFSIAIITESLKVTKDAMVTRLKCGIRGKTLIINLPGSKKASGECLNVVLPAIPHALECLRSERSRVCDCTISDFQAEKRTLSDISSQVLQFRQNQSDLGESTVQHGRQPTHNLHELQNTGSQNITEDELGLFDVDVESLPSSIINQANAKGTPTPSETSRCRDTPVKEDTDDFLEISVDQAFATVLENTKILGTEAVSGADAFGKILAEDVIAAYALPPNDVARVSGYAVSGSILEGEIRTIRISNIGLGVVSRGQAAQVSAGSTLPTTTNTIISVDNTQLLDGNKIKIIKSVPSGQGVKPAGSDYSANQVVLVRGAKLGPADIGKLTSIGVTTCKTYKNPTVAVLTVGNSDTEEPNHITLQLSLQQHSVKPIDAGIVPENKQQVSLYLKKAIESADVVITTGKSESGRNLVKSIIKSQFKATIHFSNVSMRPWTKSYFATADTENGQKLFFLLPECPLACILCTIFVIPALRKMKGMEDPQHTILKAKVPNNVQLFDRTEYQQCRVSWRPNDTVPWIESIDTEISNRPPTVYDANALLILPERTDQCSVLKRGDIVDVLLITSA